jgi:hypothetical protein
MMDTHGATPDRKVIHEWSPIRKKVLFILYIGWLLLSIFSYYSTGSAPIRALQVGSLVSGLFIGTYKIHEAKYFVYALSLVTVSTLGILFYKSLGFTGLYPLGVLFIGIIIHRSYKNYPRPFLGFILAVFLFTVTFLNYEILIKGTPPNEVLRYSRNHIATIILSLITLSYTSICFFNYKYYYEASSIALVVYGTISMVVYTGRSGFSSGLIVLLAIMIHIGKSVRWYFIILATSLAPFIFYEIYQIIVQYSVPLKTLLTKGIYSSRFIFWSDILPLMLDYKFALGLDVGKYTKHQNIHNSYLNFFVEYGWFGLLFITIVSWKLLLLVYKFRIALWLIICAVLGRAFFDTVLLSLMLGPPVLFCFLCVSQMYSVTRGQV